LGVDRPDPPGPIFFKEPDMFSLRIQSLTAAFLIVATAACASSPAATSGGTDPAPGAQPAGQATPAAADEIRITVNQNKFDAGRMAIWVAGDVGVPRMMGELDAGETRTFIHKVAGAGRRVQLNARNGSGTDIRSEFLNVPPGSGVNWDIQLNRISLRR
jgi:hypothetical protein